MIYFDNAATTLKKPPQVIHAVTEAMLTCANHGRGAHRAAMRASEEIYACRKAAGAMFGAPPERVIITSGATHSLNMAIAAAGERDGALLISDLEHNAVLRPVMAQRREVRMFSSALHEKKSERTQIIADSAERAADGAAAVVCTAASNICGASMPIRELGELCRRRGILFVVDGAQAGGTIPLDMERDCIDVLCLPGHKGLYGPMGCGLMILGEGVMLPPFILGGSGIDSSSHRMPGMPPERYEAGTLPVPLAAGLRRGIEWVASKGVDRIHAHEIRLTGIMKRALASMDAKVYAPDHDGGTVLFNISGIECEELAAMLDERGICVRAGLHCAPLAHDTLGSTGAVRASVGAFNTESEICRFIETLRQICKKRL